MTGNGYNSLEILFWSIERQPGVDGKLAIRIVVISGSARGVSNVEALFIVCVEQGVSDSLVNQVYDKQRPTDFQTFRLVQVYQKLVEASSGFTILVLCVGC